MKQNVDKDIVTKQYFPMFDSKERKKGLETGLIVVIGDAILVFGGARGQQESGPWKPWYRGTSNQIRSPQSLNSYMCTVFFFDVFGPDQDRQEPISFDNFKSVRF